MFRYVVSVDAFTGTKTNSFKARGVDETTFPAANCSSNVTIGKNGKVPAMSEWSAMITFVLLCLGGLYLARRKRTN